MRINSIVTLMTVMWTGSIAVAYQTSNPLYLTVPYILCAANELLYATCGFDMFLSSERTELFYDMATIPTRAFVGDNYSEGYWPDGDYTISPQKAEDNKFAKIIELIGAKEGDTILDFGCGTGSFVVYCESKGIKAIGMTLSSEQVKYGLGRCRDPSMSDIIQWNYTKFNEKYRNMADHIIILGSPEHIWTGGSMMGETYINKKQVMTKLLDMCKDYFKRDDKPHRIFVSCLHITDEYIRTPEYYIFERTYGGTLQLNDPKYDLKASAEATGYIPIYRRDATEDYYMASVLDPNHFGNPGAPFSKCSNMLFILGFIYPICWFILAYNLCGIWMWMFDGRQHYDWNKRFAIGDTPASRPCTLWWDVIEYQPPNKPSQLSSS